MKRWQHLAAITAALLALLSLLAACGPSASTTNNGNSTQPKAGGNVVDIFDEEPDSLLPWNTGETFGLMAQQQLWAGLWNTDQNVNITLDGGIAKELPSIANGDVSSDLTTFTIKLKPNLKWSDGSAETAQDCVDTYSFLSDPTVGDLGAFPTTAATDPFVFVSATKVDDTTFKLQFKNPVGPFLTIFANSTDTCMPSAFIKTVTPATYGKDAQNFQPKVMNGPFMIKERVGGSHITVVKNPDYFDAPAKPYLNQITDQIITDSNTIVQAFQANSADSGWFLDPTKLATFQALPGYTSYVDNGAGFEWLVYNLHDPILKDKVVRQALQESIDPPNEIYKTIYNGTVKPTCDDHAGTFAHEPNLIPCYKFDQADAGKILDADGWMMGSDNYRHKNGQTLELQYATTAKQSREDTQAIFIQDWKKIGIKVNQKNYSNTQDWFGTGALCQGNFQIGEFANSITDPDDHTVFSSDQLCLTTSGGLNYGFYSNVTVDQQEKVQIATLDLNARKAAFHIIHQQILQDIPCTYLFAPANLSVHSNRLHNYLPSPAGATETQNVWDWWVS